jgi:hypothetical protein
MCKLKGEESMTAQDDSHPSFYETCVKHHVDFAALLNDLVMHGAHERVDCAGANLFFHHGLGEPKLVDEMLAALSRLSGVKYDRSNFGQIVLLGDDTQRKENSAPFPEADAIN